MSTSVETSVAESVGRRILERRGSEVLELMYFLDERHALDLLREFIALPGDEQSKLVDFLKSANRRDGVTLCVGRDSLQLQPGG
jgi:hypothetical protein